MKKNMLIASSALALLLAAGPAEAAQPRKAWVTDKVEISLRNGPSTGNKVLRLLYSDAEVEVLDERGEWMHIRTAEGEDGYVLGRYIVTDRPTSLVAAEWQARYEQIKALSGDCVQKALDLQAENERLQADSQQLQRLRSDSSDVAALSDERDELARRMTELNTAMQELKAQNMDIKSSNSLRWFMAGAGVVFISWLFGFLMGRIGKKRKATLMR